MAGPLVARVNPNRCIRNSPQHSTITIPPQLRSIPRSKSKILLLDAMHLERRDKNRVLIFTIVVVEISNRNYCCHDGSILQWFVVLPAVAGLILARENSRALGRKLKIGMRFH